MQTKSNVKGTLRTVTPSMAAEILERNKNNRTLRESVVDSYAQDMRNGHWLVNNQGIALADDGSLLDGQHRLSAIVRSGVSVPMLVVAGLPVRGGSNGVKLRTIDTIDVGIARGLGDLMSMGHGVKNANVVVACLRTIIELAGVGVHRITMPVALQVLQLYRGSVERVVGQANWQRGLHNASVLGSLAFAAKAFPDEVEKFTANLFSGENLRGGSPVLHLRNFLLSGKAKYKGPIKKVVPRAVLSAVMYEIERRAIVQRLYQSPAGIEYFREHQEAAIEKVKAIFNRPEEESAE
jgi:hypothetical protein